MTELKPRLTYRPDIDGLRALAVVSVLTFHYSTNTLPGGFIGVDVFFVISGYLITGLLVKSFENHNFSLLDFYQRRVRRIFPALILVLMTCLIVGWVALFPNEYATLGRHIAASAGFVENINLWFESGYFDNDAITKPLLHFWSLAVEEQFYIFWPLILWVCITLRCRLMLAIIIIALISFGLNIWSLTHDQSMAFYWPLMRAWELMAGAWLAVGHRRKVQLLTHYKAWQSWLGLLLIILGLILIRPERGFPGWWGLLPVLGSVLLINAGMDAWLNRKVFASRPAVWIGLISYPMYLWHWMLWSLAIVIFDNTPWLHSAKIAAITLVIPLSWATYYYLEQPIRRRSKGKTTAWLAVIVAILGLIGLSIYKFDGIPNRLGVYSAEQQELIDQYITSSGMTKLKDSCIDLDQQSGEWYCTLGNSDSEDWLMVYGDSHAMTLAPFWNHYGKERNLRIILSTVSACPPLIGIHVARFAEKCSGLVNHVLNKIKDEPLAVTIINRWSQNTGGVIRERDIREMWLASDSATHRVSRAERRDYNKRVLAQGLDSTFEFYQKKNIPVIIFQDNPQQKTELPLGVLRFGSNDEAINRVAVSDELSKADQRESRQIVFDVAKKYKNVSVVDVKKFLCDTKKCPWALDGKFLYSDRDHLSVGGNDYLYPFLAMELDDVLLPK